MSCQERKTQRRDGACRACPIIILYMSSLYKCVDCTFWLAGRCGSIRIKSSTVQSSRKRAGKITLSLKNAQSVWLSLPFFWMRFCTCLLYHTRRRSAGDVTGHKCAGLFDIVYWCVLCLRARMQHTIEISTHIMRAHNMPCHHHQDTHQQETTHTPPKAIQMPPQHQKNTSQT